MNVIRFEKTLTDHLRLPQLEELLEISADLTDDLSITDMIINILDGMYLIEINYYVL